PSDLIARTPGYIKVVPNTEYFYKIFSEGDVGISLRFYDKNFNHIGSSGSSNATDRFFTNPEGCEYLRIHFSTVNDISKFKFTITLGGYPEEYVEPSETYKLFHSAQDEEDFVLRSNVYGSVADELNGDVITRRFKEVVLDGTLGWEYGQSSTG